jgi:hypothetical protein
MQRVSVRVGNPSKMLTNKADILNALDAEIRQLQLARELLSAEPKAGKRATGSVMRNDPGVWTARRKRRRMSAEARARIAASQKKRWAALKSARNKK